MTKVENVRFWDCKKCFNKENGFIPVDITIKGKQQITKCLGCGNIARYTVRKKGGAGITRYEDDQNKKVITDRALLVKVDWEKGVCTDVIQSDSKHYPDNTK